MGSGGSKNSARAPNNPMELQQYNREEYEREYRRVEKEERRRAKAEEKAQQMAALRTPAPPFVPKKPEPKFAEADYDAEAKRRMQDQLAWDSQTFVLNQLMLSVQFFENYEREMWDAVDRNRQQENIETQHIEQHCKLVLLPDRLQEAIDRRIKFCPRHGNQKSQVRPLHPQSMYIVHENIEITNPGERSNYSILTDAPIYKLEIDTPTPVENKQRHVGYVRLKCVEGIHINRKTSVEPRRRSNDDSSDSDESAVQYSAAGTKSKYRDSIMRMSEGAKRLQRRRLTNGGLAQQHRSSIKRPHLLTPPKNASGQTSSGSSSTEYDYAYITAMNVRQPLSAAQSGETDTNPVSSTVLPESCFYHVPHRSHGSSNDEEDDDDSQDERDFEMRQFLSSKTFLTYFINMFRDTLAKDMEIPRQYLESATWKGAIIYSEPWEIVPALSAPWPNEAFEWMHRQRDIKVNPLTQQKFQWPTPDMVNKVVSFGCLLVPLGFSPKSGLNAQRELEWKIVFPNAERYLESCLTAAQCKVYIVAKALLQTFVEPFLEGSANGFTNEHLRAHLFWQCELNYAAWPEDYLGETLVRFLNSLLEHIKRQRLPDYFLPKRNLFENVPERIMVDLHKRIFRITENPLMHTMIALRNLRCELGFQVRFDCKRLYEVMTIDNPLKILNPKFQSEVDERPKTDGEGGGGAPEAIESDEEGGQLAMGAIGYHQKADKNGKNKRRKTRKVRFLEAERITEELERAARRVSVESIDVRFDKIKHMEQLRRVIIYELFINHYIDMAREATPFNAFNQALIYLKQATRLCSLLSDDDRVEQSTNYMQIIETLQEVVMNERHRDSQTKPQLPQRDSVRYQSAHRVNRVRVARPIPSSYDPYKNSEIMTNNNGIVTTGDEEAMQGASKKRATPKIIVVTSTESDAPKMNIQSQLERIVSNQRQLVQCDVHSPSSDLDYMPTTPLTPAKPMRAVCFNRFLDGNTSDDTDSVLSHTTPNQMGSNGHERFASHSSRNMSASSDDVITAF